MLKILIIDDSLTIRKMLERMLSDLGLNVIATAKSAKEGIELYKKHQPDFVTMDVNMPEMTGIEALKIIRDDYKDANIVMLTSKGDDDSVVQAIKYGAKGYILKPPNPTKIKDSIIAVFPNEFSEKTIQNKELDVQNYESSIKDSLTDLYTIQYMHSTIQHLVAVHDKNENYSICMIKIDIKNLNIISKEFGVMQRDIILMQVADTIQNLIDESNIAIKLSNNEFGIFIISEPSSSINVTTLAIKESIESISNKTAINDTKLQTSIGVANHVQNEKLIHFLERVDMALVKAHSNSTGIFVDKL